MSTDDKTREPCPRCGKKLKPLTPAVKAQDQSFRAQQPQIGDERGPPGTRGHACRPQPHYTCRSVDDGTTLICGARHRTIGAAERCIRTDALAPGLLRESRGEIVEVLPSGQEGAVVKRYRSAEKSSIRGRIGSMRAVWVEVPITNATEATS